MTESATNQLKEELLESISELFLKYGLRSTSMEDICTHLKISKKTLYQCFSNKDDVVEQVMLHRRRGHRVQRDVERLKERGAIEIMLSMRDSIIAGLSTRMPANMFDLKKYHPEVYRHIMEEDQRFISELFDFMIDKGIREGDFREGINREIQVYLFVKQMSLLGEPELMSEIAYPVEVIVTTIMENIIRSFVTPAGMERLVHLIGDGRQEEKTNNKQL